MVEDKSAEDELSAIRDAIEEGSSAATIDELAKRGVHKVRVIREDQINKLIHQAVDKVVQKRSLHMVEEERDRMIRESRQELQTLMRKHQEAVNHKEMIEKSRDELQGQLARLMSESSPATISALEGQIGKLLSTLETTEQARVALEEEVDTLQVDVMTLQEEFAEADADRDRLQVRVRDLLLASSNIIQEAFYLEQDFLQEDHGDARDVTDRPDNEDPTREIFREFEHTAEILKLAREKMVGMLDGTDRIETQSRDGSSVVSALEDNLQRSHQRERDLDGKVRKMEGEVREMLTILSRIFA